VSAACTIGLGNIWKFPYMAGMYGGAVFVLFYVFFLFIFGVPLVTMEFAVGRASQRSAALSFHELAGKNSGWRHCGWFIISGNYLIMMFYTTVSGWVLAYLIYSMQGKFANVTREGAMDIFDALLASPAQSVLWMAAITALGFGVCALGLQKGVERVANAMMVALFIALLILVVRAMMLPGVGAGLEFYLKPNLEPIRTLGFWTIAYAAMSQAFFSSSIGMGCMALFGSYIGRERRLFGEAVNLTILNAMSAILVGMVIFPACYSFGISPDVGPSLIFITLPNILYSMPGGAIWGVLFFVFLFFAAFSTVLTVCENIVAFTIDKTGYSRVKSCMINLAVLIPLSLPCALGFNLLKSFQPLGPDSNIFSLEDFIASNNFMPLGGLIYLLFCVTRYGWKWENLIAEINTGKGLKLPAALKRYCMYVLPALVMIVFVFGYVGFFK
jgi:NSS family neurotransmitter:Na+ symporter